MAIKNIELLRNNCKQLALMVLGFVVCISLLEAKGFVVWAKRLEVGPTQQVVLTTMEKLEIAWSAVAEPVVNFRPQALEFLTRHGWSDMPVFVAAQETQGTGKYPELEDAAPAHTTPNEGEAQEPTDGATEGGNPEPEQVPPQEPEDGGNSDKPGMVETPSVAVDSGKPLPAQPDAAGNLVSLPLLGQGQSRHVVLAGDSMMAVGLAPQLQKELVAFKTTASTARAYRAATGLARPDVFDWQKEYPRMIGDKMPDVVIVAIGGNDTQNLDVNRKVLTIGSDEWNAVYEERLTNYLNMLTKDGAIVLWIKLPPMRPNKYNRNVISVNEVAQKVVAANPRAIWWDVSERFVNAEGKFMEFAVVPPSNRQVRIRQSDGIHLTDNGAKLISGDIMAWLNLAAPVVTPPVTSVVEEILIPIETPVSESGIVTPVNEAPSTETPVDLQR